MPTVDLQTLTNDADLTKINTHLIRQQRELTWLLSSLDEENVKGLSTAKGNNNSISVTRKALKVSYNDANNIEIAPQPIGQNAPRLYFNSGSYRGSIGMNNSVFHISTTGNVGSTYTTMLMESRSLQVNTVDNIVFNGSSFKLPNASTYLRAYAAPYSSASEVEDLANSFNGAMSMLRAMGIFF